MTERHAHSELIDALGGPAKTARAAEGRAGIKLKVGTVIAWRRRGIAEGWRATIAAIAGERGIPLPPNFLVPLGEPHA